MSLREVFLSLALALGVGALIGAERQQSQATVDERDFGGIRTFPLLALLGALGALSRPVAGLWLLGLLLAAVAALLAVSHARAAAEGHPGISTEVAGLLTFVLGAVSAMPDVLPGTDRYLVVASSAAVIMALLAMKAPLHGFIAKVSAADTYATVKFVILALVVLPVLPDRTFGPLDVLNPFKIGLMIALVAGVSFAGYVAARVVGSRRGLLATGLLGGLASSTAVTLTFSGRAKETPSLANLCAIAITAASATMFARILVIVAVADPRLVTALAWPMGTMALVGFGAAGVLYRREAKDGENAREVPLKNPFELGQAVKFGLVYAAVLVVAKAAQTYLGSGGVLVSSFLAGLTDVDAITLSLTELHRGGMSSSLAATGIALAAATNTLVKVGIAFSIGGAPLGRRVGAIFLAVLASGGCALLAASALVA